MSNLLEKASIVTTPTAYDNGKILSVKPAPSLGGELVTNGDFATDSDWTKGTGWSIEDGKVYFDNPTGTELYQSLSTTASKYRISFDLDITSGTIQTSFSSPSTSTIESFTTSGTKTVDITTTASFSRFRFVGVGGSVFNIDNVSVKEVIDGDFDFTRNSSATRVNSQGLIEDVQILSSNLVSNGDFSQEGSELVTNGDFATDSDWNLETTWTIENGVANGNGAVGSTEELTQFNTFTLGKTYKVVYEILNYVSGNIQFQFSGGSTLSGTTRSSNGTYTEYVVATANHTLLKFKAGSAFNGSIDNVSVKEVGQDWTFLGDFETDGTKAFITNASQYSQLTNQIGVNYLLSGNKYRLTFDIPTLSISGAFAYRYTGGSVTPILTTDIQNGKFTTDFIMPSNGYFWLQTTGSYTGLNVEVDNVSVIEITDDTDLPRIDYTGGEGHWLFEPQSTNLLDYSNDFSQSYWTKQSGVTATYNTTETLSPDGTYNATKFVGNGTTGVFKASISVSGVVSRSFYLKSVTGTTTAVFKEPNTNVPSPITLTITNEWQRFEMIGDNGSSFQGLQIDDITSEGLFMWGAQLEVGSFPTSYIPTNGSTVTRLQDAAFGAGSSDLINSTEGVLYFEGSALTDTDTTNPNRGISISSGSTNNTIFIYYQAALNTLACILISNGTTQFSHSTSLFDVDDYLKIALKYKQNDFALWVNGTEIATDTSGNAPIGLNELAFDNGVGNDKFYGKVKCVAVFTEALTDEELTCLTTI